MCRSLAFDRAREISDDRHPGGAVALVSAGPWKWAAVASPVNPEYVIVHVSFFDVVSYAASTAPVSLFHSGVPRSNP